MKDQLLSFGERLIAGLQRHAVKSPSRWAEEYVKNPDGSGINFRRFPWQREMLDSRATYNVAAKGAQIGVSHMALMRGICANDMEHRDVLYVLPNMNPLGSDFSSARFDAMVRASKHLQSLYTQGSNVGHKSTTTNSFYIRGAQSKAGGKSIPVGMLVLDEINEIPKEFIPLVMERLSGQEEKLTWAISTPTVPDHGISKLWEESTQEFFCFPCPHCSKWINLTFPESIHIVGDDPDSLVTLTESYLKCPECQGQLDHKQKPELFAKAHFVPTVGGKDKRGFYVNQLYSTTVTPGEIAAAAIRAQLSDIDAQEFHNSKLGQAHAPKGSKLTDQEIERCKGTHLNGQLEPTWQIVTMGVDVGAWCHWEVVEWRLGDSYGVDVNTDAVGRVLACGRVRTFDELDALMIRWRVHFAVVDAMPETRASFAFSQRFWGAVKLCYYAQGVQGKILTESKWGQGEPVVNVNRTAWLDQSLGRVKRAQLILPMDVPFEYIDHLKAPCRIWKRDSSGNPVAYYETPDKKHDHHAHARNYSEVALALAASLGGNKDISSPLD